jgi:hypothetical protein
VQAAVVKVLATADRLVRLADVQTAVDARSGSLSKDSINSCLSMGARGERAAFRAGRPWLLPTQASAKSTSGAGCRSMIWGIGRLLHPGVLWYWTQLFFEKVGLVLGQTPELREVDSVDVPGVLLAHKPGDGPRWFLSQNGAFSTALIVGEHYCCTLPNHGAEPY